MATVGRKDYSDAKEIDRKDLNRPGRRRSRVCLSALMFKVLCEIGSYIDRFELVQDHSGW